MHDATSSIRSEDEVPSCATKLAVRLTNMDSGTGVLNQYGHALVDQFDASWMQVAAAWQGTGFGESEHDCANPLLWTAAGVGRADKSTCLPVDALHL
jgi:hypothetical protein